MGVHSPARLRHDLRSRDASRGFILVVVIWITVLLALMSAAFSKAVQSYVRETAQRTRASEADLLADAGLNLAALDLSMVRDGALKAGRFVTTGAAIGCQAGERGALFIRVQDASGRVNLNLATEQLLKALLLGLGLSADEASRSAARIIDFRDRDSDRGPQGAELDEYTAAGEAIGPKNAAFESFDELAQVLGLSDETIALLSPHVTIYSGVAGIDPKSATPELLDILEAGFRRLPSENGQGIGSQGIPDDVRMPTSKRFYVVSVTAHLGGGTEVSKVADLDLSQARGSIPTLRALRRIPNAEKRGQVDLAALPQC